MIRLNHITASYQSTPVISDLSLTIRRGERVALVGPNGAGKSSLLRVITGHLKSQGEVHIAGHNIAQLRPRARARLMATVPQETSSALPLAAYDFVLLGRTACLSRWRGPTDLDHTAVQQAMRLTETWDLRHRPFAEMSGGERQRLALAMALAGNPEIILLDEPTSHLDLRHRAELMRLLLQLNRDQQTTILMVMHDLTLASQFFPRIILLSQGHLVADGSPGAVLQPTTLTQAYGCPVRVIPVPDSGATCVLPVT